MTDPVLTFAPLPRSTRNGRPISHNFQQIAQQLKDNPGQWARIDTRGTQPAARSFAFHVRNGTSRAFQPAGAFEATVRNQDIWARYVGETGEHA